MGTVSDAGDFTSPRTTDGSGGRGPENLLWKVAAHDHLGRTFRYTFPFEARRRESATARERFALYLATDDVGAAAEFERSFPAAAATAPGGVHVVWRENVRRTTGGMREDGVDNEVLSSARPGRAGLDPLLSP